MNAQKVLVILPHAEGEVGLDTRPEVQAILRSHGSENVKVMDNPSRIDIAEEIGRDDYDILHMAGHCSISGFPIRDGVLSPRTIAGYSLCMAPKLGLVILNACSSDDVAREIGATANVDVIYTERNVEDAECIDFAILFHSKLRLPSIIDYYDAHRMVDPSGRDFKFRYGASAKNMNRPNDDERLKSIEVTVGEIREFLVGSLQKPGLSAGVQNLTKQVEEHELRIKRLEANNGFIRTSEEHEARIKKIEESVFPASMNAGLTERAFYMRMLVYSAVVLLLVVFVYLLSTRGGG